MAAKGLSGLSSLGARVRLVEALKDLYHEKNVDTVLAKATEVESLVALFPDLSALMKARIAVTKLQTDARDNRARESLEEAIVSAFHHDIQNEGSKHVKLIVGLLCRLGMLSIARTTADFIGALAREEVSEARPSLVTDLPDIGIVLSHVNLPEAALALHSAALDHARKFPEQVPGHSLAVCLRCAAWEALDLGMFDEALAYAKESLQIILEIKDANSHRAYGLVAATQEKMGLFKECLENYAIAVRLTRASGLTFSSATTILNQAVAFLLTGRYDDAEEGFREVQRLRNFPPLSKTQTVLLNMPELHFLQGKKELALEEVEKILALYDDDGEERPLYRTKMIYGDILADAGRLEESLQAYDDAIDIVHEVMGGNEKLLGEVTIGIGRALHGANRPAEAKIQLEEGCRMMAKVMPRGHPRLAKGLRELATVLREEGLLREALQKAEESVAMAALIFGDGHEETLQCLECVETCVE